MKVYLVGLIALILFIGCTFIGFNRGDVRTSEKDSHDANGTNTARTFDVNIDPR